MDSTLTHYDRLRVGQLCEKVGCTSMRALQHYTDLVDIKRVLINTHAIDTQVWRKMCGGLGMGGLPHGSEGASTQQMFNASSSAIDKQELVVVVVEKELY